MQRSSNDFILNIVPLFNVANNASGEDTIALLQTQVNTLQEIYNTTTYTVSANAIQPYSVGSIVEMTGDFNVTGNFTVNAQSVVTSGATTNVEVASSNFQVDAGTNTLLLQTVGNPYTFSIRTNPVMTINNSGITTFSGLSGSNLSNASVSNAVLFSSVTVYADRVAVGSVITRPVSTLMDVLGDAYIQQLFVSTNIYCTRLFETSDQRRKEHICTLETPLNQLMKLRGVEYDLAGKHEYGFLAQEVASNFPFAVDSTQEASSIHYTSFIALLVESVKELTARVERLESMMH